MNRSTPMRAIPPPHPTQREPIAHPARQLFVEAGPGTGKTYVLAERFGKLAFGQAAATGGVTALSFTISATGVLSRALARRWGPQATGWPNRVQTFDSLFRSLLDFLLRSALVTWPNGHHSIEPIDEWTGRRPAPRRHATAWEPHLDGTSVVARSRSATEGDLVVATKRQMLAQLDAGICTHESIRDIVTEAAAQPPLRERLVGFLAAGADAYLVDELFDANASDVELLALIIEADCGITAVGDPWQALYAFRAECDVEVDVRAALLDRFAFETTSLTESFRFADGTQPQQLSAQMRACAPCALPPAVANPDVVLAPKWRILWGAGPEVLPLAFGQVRTQLDAVMALLLDYVVRGIGQSGARLAATAPQILRVDGRTVAERAPEAFEPILEQLLDTSDERASAALDLLLNVPRDYFGAARRLQAKPDVRSAADQSLRGLGDRLRHGGASVPGLTVHQAKGAEWDRVAVLLSADDEEALAAGLSLENPDHRRLYVALTRGRLASGRYIRAEPHAG